MIDFYLHCQSLDGFLNSMGKPIPSFFGTGAANQAAQEDGTLSRGFPALHFRVKSEEEATPILEAFEAFAGEQKDAMVFYADVLTAVNVIAHTSFAGSRVAMIRNFTPIV